ncbi:hypothetical protein Syun_012603 [Stephania yunnanensis]|uniref:Uncharacterized protein n=1 Tax=Stephania yunnanensis TaxID=152371 RepID=A0AAP0JZP9_9MAGN
MPPHPPTSRRSPPFSHSPHCRVLHLLIVCVLPPTTLRLIALASRPLPYNHCPATVAENLARVLRTKRGRIRDSREVGALA